jgi:hypothetical protein
MFQLKIVLKLYNNKNTGRNKHSGQFFEEKGKEFEMKAQWF